MTIRKKPKRRTTITHDMLDVLAKGIKRRRPKVAVARAMLGITVYQPDTGAPIARLNPVPGTDKFTVRWWSGFRGCWMQAEALGDAVMTLEDAGPYVAAALLAAVLATDTTKISPDPRVTIAVDSSRKELVLRAGPFDLPNMPPMDDHAMMRDRGMAHDTPIQRFACQTISTSPFPGSRVKRSCSASTSSASRPRPDQPARPETPNQVMSFVRWGCRMTLADRL